MTLTQAAGAKGKRYSMKNTRIMMHQPAGGAMGSADEVNIQASELNRTMKATLTLPCFLLRFHLLASSFSSLQLFVPSWQSLVR